MQRLLLALLLSPLTVAAQSTLNDLDGDGCVGATDILVILGQYGECNDTTAVFACGDSVLFNSYWYETVLIGDQCWFAENLRTTVYANGDTIPAGLTDSEWTSTMVGATAIMGEGAGSCVNASPDFNFCDAEEALMVTGRLYNWYAVDDGRGLCPLGWHIPTDTEWTDLKDFLGIQGFSGTEGTALKATTSWADDGNGTDDFGFSGLGGGYRSLTASWGSVGTGGYWWTSSLDGSNVWYRYMRFNTDNLSRTSSGAVNGFSVRCIQD